MIRIDVDEVKSELNLTPFGAQGWLTDKNNGCPYCGKKGKWGVRLNLNGGVIHCWKCGTKKGLYDYLKEINRLDLIKAHYENSIKSSLVSLVDEEEEIKEEEIKEVALPKRLELLINDPYLDGRGFREIHYKEFEPSITNFFLEKKLWDYIIFKLKMDGRVIAWLARSRKTKEWHEKNLKESKEKGIKPILRYENSETNFTKILGGYDNITDKTEIVIMVEGLFDYIGVDNKLRLREDEQIRCVFTFGNSVSKDQVNLLKKKGIKTVILMYDPDKLSEIKSNALILQKTFNTWIALLKDVKKDPGDATEEELLEALSDLTDPINFYVDKLDKRW